MHPIAGKLFLSLASCENYTQMEKMAQKRLFTRPARLRHSSLVTQMAQMGVTS